jgi:demethylmenaquinone methyltransferase/2-methoxy-6-polyprenyl-1,4-benzoquinol methylase
VDEDRLLAEQRAFYRRRAPEYDDWWQRRGRYDSGPQDAAEWQAQVSVLEAALAEFAPTGDVVELAGGTGWWTERLATVAGSLTVVDSSPETLELSRRRVGRPDVRYEVADLFEWPAAADYDVVFFSFWLSHVPTAWFSRFWTVVGSLLRPGGRVFLIDNRRDPTVAREDPVVVDEGGGIQRRRLSDGSEHRVIKLLYEPAELGRVLAEEGWRAEIDGTRWFIYGSARPAG